MPETILIVEDELHLRELVHDELVENNYNVLTAENGATALKIIEEKMPDLVILDMKLPDISGTEILAAIRQYNTQVPVIICTAIPQPKLKTYYDRWANVVISKPADLDLLLKTVKELLDKYNQLRKI
ncbi:MAG: response regulator [Elusimicrobia bacterium]|nr:response regulator [Elusimicrobiota bacterium]